MKPTAGSCASAVSLLLINLWTAPVWAQDQQPKLQITIVEGEGAINNVKERVNREPIVQVEDENHKPVAGAAVVFFLPNQGPGGTFADGTRSLTVTTDAQGRAVARGIRFNKSTGQMQIRVTATANGQTATASITQTNVAGGGGGGASASAGGLSTAAKVLIIVGLAAGAAAGAVVATRGGGSSNSSPSGIPTAITPGTPTVGAP